MNIKSNQFISKCLSVIILFTLSPLWATALELNPDQKQKAISEGVRLAKNFLDIAIKSDDPPGWLDIYKRIRARLEGKAFIQHHSNPAFDFSFCRIKHLAVAFPWISADIYICQLIFKEFGTNYSAYAQVIIHEAAHLEGFYDECTATQIERNVMNRGEGGLQFKNGYMDSCGL